MHDMRKKIMELFENSENAKLTKESFTFEDGHRVSSVIKVVRSGVIDPLIINKRWEYDEQNRLVSIKAQIEPDKPAQPIKILNKKNADAVNPAYEEEELCSWEYDEQGRLIRSVDEKGTHDIVYTGDHDFTDTVISRSTLAHTVKTVVNDILVREVTTNIAGTIDISYEYELAGHRKIIKKIIQDGKLIRKEENLEKHQEDFGWYIINSTITSIGDDISTMMIQLELDEPEHKRWRYLYTDHNNTSYTFEFKNNCIYYNDQLYLKGVFPVKDKVTETKINEYLPWVDLKHLTFMEKIPDSITLSRGSGSVMTFKDDTHTVVSEFNVMGRRVVNTYTSRDILVKAIYADADECNIPTMCRIATNNLRFNLMKQVESNKYQCRVEDKGEDEKNRIYTLTIYLGDKEANELTNYILESLGILPEFNRFK